MRRKIIITRSSQIKDEKNGNHFVDASKMVGYEDYVRKYGHHFTDRLAEYASRKMENSNGSEHSWTADQVREAMEDIPKVVTYGDMTYLANMAYSDFYPKVLGTVAGCLSYAKAVAEDKDGYEGMPFIRWVADLNGKKETINWLDFIDGE